MSLNRNETLVKCRPQKEHTHSQRSFIDCTCQRMYNRKHHSDRFHVENGQKQKNGNALAYNKQVAKTCQFQVHDLGSQTFT